MATRSVIGMTLTNGEIKAIYCHWDGYLSNNGMILYNCYNTVEQVEALMSLGDLSSLRKHIGEKTDMMNDLTMTRTAVVNDWCEFYGRDRGDEGCEARILKDNRKLKSLAESMWAEWIYLYDCHNKEWLVKPTSEGRYKKLYDILLEDGLIDPIDELLNTAKQD
jgi:hypothetical protein